MRALDSGMIIDDSFAHSSLHSFGHPFINSFIRSFIHFFLHTISPLYFSLLPIDPFNGPSFKMLTNSFINLFIHLFVHSFIHTFIHPCIYLFNDSFSYSSIHSDDKMLSHYLQAKYFCFAVFSLSVLLLN